MFKKLVQYVYLMYEQILFDLNLIYDKNKIKINEVFYKKIYMCC